MVDANEQGIFVTITLKLALSLVGRGDYRPFIEPEPTLEAER